MANELRSNTDERWIGTYDEGIRGPLIFMMGGIHGNEKAGVTALEYLIKMLEVEPVTNENFSFTGRLVALKGNIQALQKRVRFVKQDLNRMFRPEVMTEIRNKEILKDEEKELIEIVEFFEKHIEAYQPEKVFLLDLHTTSVSGGIFTITDESPSALQLGLELGAPVIEGFLSGLQGTVLHYVSDRYLHPDSTALVFEAGQHEDKLSVNRAIAAAVNFLSAIGAVEKFHIAPRHAKILWDSAHGLPAHNRLMYTHRITPEDRFEMKPGFSNFENIRKGQILANSARGEIAAPMDGLLLMPLYQEKGDDGFFIVKPASDVRIT